MHRDGSGLAQGGDGRRQVNDRGCRAGNDEDDGGENEERKDGKEDGFSHTSILVLAVRALID